MQALTDTPVVLIHGPRQAGKSTLAQMIGRQTGARYLTLDDPMPRAMAVDDPQGFVQAYSGPIIVDEVQRAPGLFLALKASVDRDRRPGRFLLTGSANVLSLPKIADSLAGRMAIIDLLPLSQAEIEGTQPPLIDRLFRAEPGEEPSFGTGRGIAESVSSDPKRETWDWLEAREPGPFEGSGPEPPPRPLSDRILRGGFPEPFARASASRRDAWFTDYVRTLLERDVRDLANIEGLAQMPRVLKLLASRVGTALNVVDLSRETQIPNTSLHRYLDLLQAIFLTHAVPAWSTDQGTRLIKTAKMFLVDTGLLGYLLSASPGSLEGDQDRLRPLLENFVAMELRKLCLASDLRPSLYHLRTIRRLQVDLVLESRPGEVVGIQVRPTRTVRPQDADGLQLLQELAGSKFRRGVVLYLGTETLPIGRDLWAMPVSSLW